MGSGYLYPNVIHINGHAYAHGLSYRDAWGGGWASTEFNLERKCTRFRAVAGPSDNGRADARIAFEVYTDGALRSSLQLGLGQTRQIDMDVRGALRLKLAFMDVNGNDFAAGFGDPLIYCSTLTAG